MVSPATDTGGRVEVPASDEPAAANEDTPKTLSLKQRMAAIRDECFGIGKDDIEMQNADRTKKWTIKGHTFEAILSEIRPLLRKHGVDLTPNLVERTYAGNRCDVIVDFIFERTDDSEETRTVRWAGAGTDNGDKAFSKAGTNALKEMLKKRFLVTDRDDAKEEEEKVEHETEDGASRKAVAAEKERARAAIEQWAVTFKAALTTAPDLLSVQRLERDNAVQLSSPELPTVTRTFFAELIQKRKAEFKASAE